MSQSERSLFAPETELARLKVYGREFVGWTELEVVASLENCARAFTFRASERFPGESNPLRLKPGSPVEVYLGADRVMNGYIDSLDINYSATDHKITVTGRSKTSDLVDCSAVAGGSWRNQKLEDIATQLAGTYGITVKTVVNTGSKIKRHKTQRGETVFDAIERMARLRALLVTDDAAGNLLLTRAGHFETNKKGELTFSQTGTTDAHTAIVVGENVLAGNVSFDVSERFSEYRIKGQRAGDDNDYGDILQTNGEASDTAIDRTRILVLDAEARASKARCKQRAAWEAAARYGKSLKIRYTVQGWRQGNGQLWEPNQMVTVVDELSGLDADFLTVEVAYRLGAGGSTTSIQLAPVEGYEPIEPFKPRPRKRRKKKKTGAFEELRDGVKVVKTPEVEKETEAATTEEDDNG